MLGTRGDGIIPETVALDGDCECHKEPAYAVIDKDYQWNHNFIKDDITTETGSLTKPGSYVTLRTSVIAKSIFDARNTITWRTWGPACSDTICIDARKMKDGDCAGIAAFNGDSGILSIKREGSNYFLVMSEENVRLDNRTKAITDVKAKEVERVKIPKSKLKKIYLRMDGVFTPGTDNANFYYSFDGVKFTQIGSKDYKMRFDFMRLFMGSRYAAFYYPTKTAGGEVKVEL